MKHYNRTYEEQQAFEDAQYHLIEKRDEVQDELDAIALKTERKELPKQKQETAKHFVAAHLKLSEKKRAYNLAMWILKQGEKKKI